MLRCRQRGTSTRNQELQDAYLLGRVHWSNRKYMTPRSYFLLFNLFFFASLQLWAAVPITQVQEISSQAPSGLKIKMVPVEGEAPLKGKPYRVGKNLRLKVMATNNSNEIIKAYVVDTYYQNRPKLYRGE